MKHTVLTVDDDEINRYALTKILNLAGYEVISARSGNQALALVAEQGPNAVLLDINLPDVNGYEVCFRIRNDLKLTDLPVIFHTATSPTGAARSHTESVGGTAFLTYPIDADHLVSVLKGSVLRKDLTDTFTLIKVKRRDCFELRCFFVWPGGLRSFDRRRIPRPRSPRDFLYIIDRGWHGLCEAFGSNGFSNLSDESRTPD